MWIDPVLVFGEENRAFHLPDVVVEGTGPDELRVGADRAGSLGCQSGDLHGVLECAGSLFGKAQERIVDIRELDKRHHRRESEHLLDDKYQHIGE